MKLFKSKYQQDFWVTISIGSLIIISVVVLAVNFFVAIRNSQLSSRKEFLEKQTELVSRQLEMRIDEFEADAKVVREFVDDEDMDPEDFRQEFSEVVRRVFNSYPGLIDSSHVHFKDSLISFHMTSRNNFIRREIEDSIDKSGLVMVDVEGESDIRVEFFINLPSYTNRFVQDFYLDTDGSKYLIINDSLIYLSSGLSKNPISITEGSKAKIFDDVTAGLKGVYSINWYDSLSSGMAQAAQYPFDFGDIERDASLVFLLKIDDLNSGIYSTYFFLFSILVIILVGTVVVFSLAITNNEKARKELEIKSEEISDLFQRQSLLLQELRGFVFFHNYQGKITRVTDEMETILGRNLNEFYKAFQKDSRSEDVKRIRNYVLKAVENKVPYLDFEYDYVRRDGRKIRLRIFEKLSYDSDGRFLGGNGICTDITKQYESRRELINSENRLRNVIRNIPDVISIYDNRGKILSLDIKDQTEFMSDSEEFIGKRLEEVVGEKVKAEVLEAFELARRTGKIKTVEWPIRVDETKKYFEVRFFPLDNSQMMSLSKDITAQKVWEKGLVEAMNAAEKANKAKSEFLANMSHEIRTPLNGLLGIIDLIEQTKLNKQQKQYLDIIKNSGNSLLGIIKDILDYSKIEAGKIDLNDQKFSPGKELEKMVDIFLGLVKKKNIQLRYEVSDEAMGWFEGDRDKWQQVLLNLLGNATKFTPEKGKIFVRLSTEYLTDAAHFIHCEVHDSGIGIPKEKIPYLTDPFFQVESASDRAYQGTGLGLAIAKKIVQIMGGDLTIESAVGEGSVFSFSVLLSKTENQVSDLGFIELTDEGIDSDQGEKYPLNILLAEDNDLNLELMTLMLEQLNYEFDTARNGLDALNAIKLKNYDVILMDVQMPFLNGLEATKRIREGQIQNDIIIVGLSANVFDEDFKKAEEMGMDFYLTKPIRLAELAKMLKNTFLSLDRKESKSEP